MKRKYELKKRAERQAETRRRIVQAAVDLHATLGPAHTSIAAIANGAGVQRHTVYAHFPDERALFRACSNHWRAAHPLPDVSTLDLPGALSALYGWYEEVADAVALFIRDGALYPEISAERRDALAALADGLARPFGRRAVVRAAIGHALAFETWRSLTQQGLTRRQAVELMVRLVRAA